MPEICNDLELEVEGRFMAMFSQRRTVPALFKDDFQKFPFFFTSFIKAKG
jgi:hypothetical protein